MTKMLSDFYIPVPLLVSADITETATASQFLNVQGCNWVSIAVPFGAITGDVATVTLEQCPIGTTTDGSETTVGYSYRLTEVVGTEGIGALTAVGSTGFPMAASDDNKILMIEFDPDTLTAGSKYLRVVITPASTTMSSCIVGVQAYARYIHRPSTATT